MSNRSPMEVDWDQWEPQMRSTLVFIRRENEVLLIRKKRGIGAGKINGPGGKVDPGETVEQAAIRETEEEIGVTPLELEQKGELHFQFTDGLSIHCTVYVSHAFEGTPKETDEALPIWFKESEIPYDEMWQDDVYWLPEMLKGDSFKGYFTFEDDKMLGKDLSFGPIALADGDADEVDPPREDEVRADAALEKEAKEGDGDDVEAAVTVDEEDFSEERRLGLDEDAFLRLQKIVESLLIASDTALTPSALVGLFKKVVKLEAESEDEGEPLPETPWMQDIEEHQVRAAILALNETYRREGRAFTLAERAAGWKIFTRPEYAPWVRGLYPEKKPQRLSPPALETLAIIAYRQPLTKADIEAVRGVSVDGVLKMLLDRGLVHIAGRAEVAGRPLLYQTTDSFLDHFGIKTVDELPNADELRQVKLPTAEVAAVEEEASAGEAGADPAAEPSPEDSDSEEPAPASAEDSGNADEMAEPPDVPKGNSAETGPDVESGELTEPDEAEAAPRDAS